MNRSLPKPPADSLTAEEQATYQWQIWTTGFGEEGQRRLKNSTVLISRCGGLGSVVAYELAAAGIGRLILAHAGNVKHSDLNRQLLMTHDWIGKPRIESVQRRLQQLNPHVEIIPLDSNVTDELAEQWVPQGGVRSDQAALWFRKNVGAASLKHGLAHDAVSSDVDRQVASLRTLSQLKQFCRERRAAFQDRRCTFD